MKGIVSHGEVYIFVECGSAPFTMQRTDTETEFSEDIKGELQEDSILLGSIRRDVEPRQSRDVGGKQAWFLRG